MRAYADNVIIVLEPPAKKSCGLVLPDRAADKRGVRAGRVLASGPGHYRSRKVRPAARAQDCTLQVFTEETPAFIENQTRVGDRVLVDAWAGQDYVLDLTVPRHNKESVYNALGGEHGEFRIVREASIHCVIDDDAKVE